MNTQNRRRRLMGLVILFVLTLSIILWVSTRTEKTVPPAPAPPAPSGYATVTPSESPSSVTVPIVRIEPTEASAPSATHGEVPKATPVAAVAMPEAAPPEPPPSASVAPSATAQAPPPPPSAEVDAAPPPPPVVVSAPPPPPDLTGIASARFRNSVGPMYRLVLVRCVVDGTAVYSGPPGAGGVLFDRKLPPGNHTVTMTAEYQGASGGIFPYLEDYRFRGVASRAFVIRTGTTTQITATAFERGGPTTPYEERLALSLDVR